MDTLYVVMAWLLGLTKFWFHRIINNIFQSFWWRITGVEAQIKESLASPVSEKKVQVLRIVRKNIIPKSAFPMRPSEIISWHEDFYPMEYLMKQNVSLYGMMGPDVVVFVETTPGEDIFDLRAYPFTFVGQAEHAIKMIKVNTLDLIAYSESLHEPGVNVIWILHSSRCGATALAQVLRSLPNWKALSEIYWTFRGLPNTCQTKEKVERYLTSTQFHNLAKACLKVQLLHFPDDSNFCWKASGFGEAYVLPIIAKEFPKHKIIYALRNGLETVNSLFRIYNLQPVLSKLFWIINKYPSLIQRIEFLRLLRLGLTNGWMTKDILQFWMDGNLNLAELIYCTWLTNLVTLKKFGREIPMMVVEYDFYCKDLSSNLEKVLKYVGAFSPSNLQIALDSYKHDSQANSYVSRESLKSAVTWTRDERTVEKINRLVTSFNFPLFDERLTPQTFNTDRWVFLMDDTK